MGIRPPSDTAVALRAGGAVGLIGEAPFAPARDGLHPQKVYFGEGLSGADYPTPDREVRSADSGRFMEWAQSGVVLYGTSGRRQSSPVGGAGPIGLKGL